MGSEVFEQGAEIGRLRAALLDAETFLNALMDAMKVCVFRKDRSGRFTFANQRFCSLVGLASQQILGKTESDIYPPEVARRHRSEDEEVMRRLEPIESVEIIRSAEGADIYLSAIKSPWLDSKGTTAGVQGVLRDITLRKRMEVDLERQRNFLRQVVDLNPSLIFTKDLEGRFTLVNEAMAQFNGTSVDQLIGKTDRDLNTEEQTIAIRRDDQRVVDERREIFIPEEQITDKDGKSRWVQTYKRPILSSGGRVIQVLGIAMDITERKKLEEQLLAAQKMEAIGQMAGGLAHDFNNILTAIMGGADIALRKLGDASEARPMIEDIRKASERGAALTRQLLAFSRKQIVVPTVVQLNDVIRDLEMILKRLGGEQTELSLNLASDLGRTKADRSQMEQIIMNLAVNARDAMPEGGSLTIRTRNATSKRAATSDLVRPRGAAENGKQYVVLEVADTGQGMDQETISHIFEPFYTTKGPGKGTGLGLSTVYGTVKQTGGFIEVDSRPGLGSSFRIFLPRVVEAERPGAADSVSNAAPNGGSETILLVEDEELVRRLVRSVLQSRGYKVIEARHGAEAVAICRDFAGEIALLMTDVVMPQMNGRRLVELARPMRPAMKILYMSGYTDDVIGAAELSRHAAFLHKPFTPDALLATVREILDAP